MPAADVVLVSGNGYRHFSNGNRDGGRVRPYVTGGGGLLISYRNFAVPAVNGGVGVDCWTSRRIGVRVEVRDQLYVSAYGIGQLSFGVRAAIVFR